jgi:hypothetical protein
MRVASWLQGLINACHFALEHPTTCGQNKVLSMARLDQTIKMIKNKILSRAGPNTFMSCLYLAKKKKAPSEAEAKTTALQAAETKGPSKGTIVFWSDRLYLYFLFLFYQINTQVLISVPFCMFRWPCNLLQFFLP